jgi:polyisoprenoid-binding protein YceI
MLKGRHDMRARLLYAAAIALLVHPPAMDAAATTYRVDPAASRVTIHVGKAGAFSFVAGHTHEVSGPVQSGSIEVDGDDPARSQVRLVIATSELAVSANGEPEGDAPKVQEAMTGDKVLDVAHHPRITFESTAVALKDRNGSMLNLTVTGQLTIHGVTKPITVPVRVDLAAATLTAAGRFEIKQSAFGIKPISVAGVVAVKDALAIAFSVVAKR